MNKTTLIGATLLVAATTMGCQYHARGPEDYSADTKKVLTSKKGEIKSCYDQLLKKDRKLSGVVTVKFKVEAKSGKIKDTKVNKKKTTAPEPLQKCVVNAMKGLKLNPPDERDGMATFSYEFNPKG